MPIPREKKQISKMQKLIFFSRSFAVGMMTPVLTLVLLQRGAQLYNLSLLLGAYSLTVVIAEFPSGVFADLYGRKKTFLLSCILSMLSYGMMLAANSFAVLFGAIILNGLGRAFSSGSLEALVIDESVSKGTEKLAKLTGQLSILESAGLAIGAVISGLLSTIGRQYVVNITLNCGLYALLIILTCRFITEKAPIVSVELQTATIRKNRRILMQVKDSLSFVISGEKILILFIVAFVTGFALISIETYWQSAFIMISNDFWLLGIVSFIGFLCVTIGSKLAERLLVRYPSRWTTIFIVAKMLFGITVLLFAFGSALYSFIIAFAVIYLFLGAGSVTENTLLNCFAQSEKRASILSLFSLVFQAGGLFASLCGYILVSHMDFHRMWIISGSMIIVALCMYTLIKAIHTRMHIANYK